MRRRRHPHLPRVAAAAGVLLALGALAVLGRFRPPLPHIASLTGPLTSAAVQDGVLCLVWLLSVYLALALLARAARVAIQGPAWQREAILPGVIPAPPPPRPPTPLSERFQPPFKLTLTPRPDTATPSAAQMAAVAAETDAPAATLPAPQPPQPQPPAEPTLSVSVLGPLRIDGTKRPPKRVPTRELIAYLALHPHGASRDELTEALWPAQDSKKTRPRLWESATDARAALGDAWIVEGERYRLAAARCESTSTSSTRCTPAATPTATPSRRRSGARTLARRTARRLRLRLGGRAHPPSASHTDRTPRASRARAPGMRRRARRATACRASDRARPVSRGILAPRPPSRPRTRTAGVDHPPLRRPHQSARPGAWAATHARDTGHVSGATRTKLVSVIPLTRFLC